MSSHSDAAMTTSVLFLCSENAARSLMAEALLRARAGDRFEVCSAGTHPASPDSRALEALVAFGIDVNGLRSESIDRLAGRDFDYVISLCSQVSQTCERWPGGGVTLHWDFPDPRRSDDPADFGKLLQAIDQRIGLFVEVNGPAQVGPAQAITPVEFFKCLSEETRLLSLLLIEQHGELCVCDLVQALGQPQPKVSRHLAQLRRCGLLLDRRQGQWVYYRIHPAMSGWMLEVLRNTRANSAGLLEPVLQRLQPVGVARRVVTC